MAISLVASQLGVTTSTLRKWESRYGFPVAGRTASGSRFYSSEQLTELMHAVRLIQGGIKPSKLFAAGGARLQTMLANRYKPEITSQQVHPKYQETINQLYSSIKGNELLACQLQLEEIFDSFELIDAIEYIIAPLMTRVGEAWYQGELNVYQEHMISSVLASLLNLKKRNNSIADSFRIVLCTPSGEKHTLGLLLVQAALDYAGAYCIDMGSDLPADQLTAAAKGYKADVVCLSLSPHLQPSVKSGYLQQLRDLLPQQIKLWVGGQGINNLKKPPSNIKFFTSVRQAFDEFKGIEFESELINHTGSRDSR